MSIVAVMTSRSKLVTISSDANLATLRAVFNQARFQHVPVVDSMERVVGIVSVKDYFKELSPIMEAASEQAIGLFMRSRKVQHIMSSPVITIAPETGIRQAAALLVEHGISCLVVTDPQKRLLGMVTWKDMLKAALVSRAKPVQPPA